MNNKWNMYKKLTKFTAKSDIKPVLQHIECRELKIDNPFLVGRHFVATDSFKMAITMAKTPVNYDFEFPIGFYTVERYNQIAKAKNLTDIKTALLGFDEYQKQNNLVGVPFESIVEETFGKEAEPISHVYDLVSLKDVIELKMEVEKDAGTKSFAQRGNMLTVHDDLITILLMRRTDKVHPHR